MVTLLEINKAIDDRIKTAKSGTEFSTVPIVAEDVSEPIVRPSLKVNIEYGSNNKFNSNCREKNLTCRIYFFAKDRNKYKFDNAKMQDIFENAFLEDLEIKESFFVSIDNFESEVSDTVLICSFDLLVVELLPDTDPVDIELMEEIKLEMESE